MLCALFILTLVNLYPKGVSSSAVSLSSDNFDTQVAQHELVFLNFYADWCRFSQILAPIFDEAATKILQEFPQPGKVLFGKVDCDRETIIAQRFHITKYPTLKVVRHGKLMKREFRGQRSVEAIVAYVRDMLKDSVVEIKDTVDFSKIDDNKRALVAYFDSRQSLGYDVFRKIAMDLRDDCQFFVATGTLNHGNDALPSRGKIVFKPPRTKFGEQDEQYPGDVLSYDELSNWATEKCIPLVREITFENAEELIEEGLPLMILFHLPDDKESVRIYTQEVQKQLMDDKSSVNFLSADGLKFTHPLHHLGKTQKDLPLIAIDSFRHMFQFPSFKEISIPGKLKQFVDDLYSGKLHREFHFGPDPTIQTQPSMGQQDSVRITDPPKSTFRKLGPSRNRYTLLRDEL